eukprot:scaffold18180_cov128-Isochrysis_galbana.AAC.3
MSWFIKHECDPYPNNDEKYALAKAAGLQVRQVEHCELSAAASRRPPSAPGSQIAGSATGAARQISQGRDALWQNRHLLNVVSPIRLSRSPPVVSCTPRTSAHLRMSEQGSVGCGAWRSRLPAAGAFEVGSGWSSVNGYRLSNGMAH